MIHPLHLVTLHLAAQAPDLPAPPATTEASISGDPGLPPDAKLHNDRGVAMISAGQYDEGIAELERAYASMPDPLKYRAGRGKVIGSLRSAMSRRYADTGESSHLCRLRTKLQDHRTALLTALGDTGSAAAVAGTDDAIREVDATLGQRTCDGPPPPARVAPAPAPAPLIKKPAKRGQGMRLAGGALMGVGFAGLGVMTFGIVGMLDNHQKLRSLTATEWQTAEPATPEAQAEAARLYQRAEDRRTLAIISGTLGGAAFVTGLVLRVVGQRRARAFAAVPLRPAIGPTFVGLAGQLTF